MKALLNLATPARVAAVVAYVVSIAYPGVNPNLRAAIVGAVTGLYVLCVAIVEAAERKHGTVSSSQSHASAPRPPSTAVKEIR